MLYFYYKIAERKITMSASKVIKQIMVEREISVKNLAEMLGIKSQILSNKLYRDTFTYNDYVKIADMLGCTVQTVTKDSGKLFINEYIADMPETAPKTNQ